MLTLTIWGQAESTNVKVVSQMSVPEVSCLWTVRAFSITGCAICMHIPALYSSVHIMTAVQALLQHNVCACNELGKSQ